MASKHAFNNKSNKCALRLGLYGKLIYRGVAYCKKHKCYLKPLDIKEKKCKFKKCRYLRQI